MRICILCEDSKVNLARENSRSVFSSTRQASSKLNPSVSTIKRNLNIQEAAEHLTIPVSETGELPATHWFCFLNVTNEGYEKIKSIQEHSVIEEMAPKEFLEKWNLKIIK